MSIVISYCDDNLALILTDRRVTTSWGESYDEKKLYPLQASPYQYGACAGAGLDTGIFAVRDLLLTKIEPFSEEGDHFIKTYEGINEIDFTSVTDCSFGTRDTSTAITKARPAIMRFIISGTDNRIHIEKGYLERYKFYILFPQNFLDNQSLVDEFDSKFSLDGNKDWNRTTILARALSMFNYVQSRSSKYVSMSGDASILYYNPNKNLFDTDFESF